MASAGALFRLLGRLRSGLGVGLGSRWFGVASRCAFAIAAGSRARLLLGRLFVTLASVISYVESTALEQQSSASADELAHLPFAPRFEAAQVLRAGRQRLLHHRLELLEFMAAFFAEVFVCGHSSVPVRKRMVRILRMPRQCARCHEAVISALPPLIPLRLRSPDRSRKGFEPIHGVGAPSSARQAG